jgi:hypothetical protein
MVPFYYDFGLWWGLLGDTTSIFMVQNLYEVYSSLAHMWNCKKELSSNLYKGLLSPFESMVGFGDFSPLSFVEYLEGNGKLESSTIVAYVLGFTC